MKLPININALLYARTIESERIEYKSGWNPEAIMHTMWSFANDERFFFQVECAIHQEYLEQIQEDMRNNAQDTAHDTAHIVALVSDKILALMKLIQHDTLTLSVIMERMNLKHRTSFRELYLKPALQLEVVKME